MSKTDLTQLFNYKNAQLADVYKSRDEFRLAWGYPTLLTMIVHGTEYIVRVLADNDTPAGEELMIAEKAIYNQLQSGTISYEELDNRIKFFASMEDMLHMSDNVIWQMTEQAEEGDLIS